MLKRFLLVLTLAVVAASASAQELYRRPGFLAGRTLLTLSLFEEVRTEIKTTPEENSKVDAMVEKMQAEAMEAFQGANGDFPAMRAAIDKINTKYDDDLVKLLTADQVTRLKQLFVQYNGVTVAANPTFAKDLGITDDQKTKIKGLLADQSNKMAEAFQSGDFQTAMKKIQDDYVAGMTKLYTDDQTKKLKDMAGTKFEFKKVAAADGG
jgi:hypothetical protein